MRVVLAGYNIEAEMIERFGGKGREALTPEVISAAYARISRDPRNVGLLRQAARREVEGARKSNQTIIFEYGHSSVAEHAVFNFDITRISRLAVEALEGFRLASFTEKSQRYIRLVRDLVVPKEIVSAGLEQRFRRLAGFLHHEYEFLYGHIIEAGAEQESAKEDARYVMPLATSAQLGMTVNARELEYMISRLASHPLTEHRKLAKKLAASVRKVAPSLVRYPESTEYFETMPAVREEIRRNTVSRSSGYDGQGVRLIDVTPDGDARIAAALIFSSGTVPFDQAMRKASKLGTAGRRKLIGRAMRYIKSHDSTWRDFESVHLLFELVISASCFAQLKRHRMATLLQQSYEPALGISVPGSVRAARMVGRLRKAVKTAERFYRIYRRTLGPAAAYALTNAHRRRVLFGLNMREMYHFARLRSDRNAQWEIRRLSDRMCTLAAEKLPAASVLLCGKDRFGELKRSL